jgi:hypothetical protein
MMKYDNIDDYEDSMMKNSWVSGKGVNPLDTEDFYNVNLSDYNTPTSDNYFPLPPKYQDGSQAMFSNDDGIYRYNYDKGRLTSPIQKKTWTEKKCV